MCPDQHNSSNESQQILRFLHHLCPTKPQHFATGNVRSLFKHAGKGVVVYFKQQDMCVRVAGMDLCEAPADPLSLAKKTKKKHRKNSCERG